MGREAEALAVSAFLDRAAETPSALVLEGDAGIGKTTLWLDGVKQARGRGFHVLSARAGAAEVSLAFTALADLLADVGPAVPTALPASQRRALALVLEHTATGPATSERVVGAAVLNVIEGLAAQKPLLLAIDDVQWLDSASRTVLGFALRRTTGPVGVLVTLRPDAVDPTVSAWLQSSTAEGVERFSMVPLSPNELHEVLTTRLGRALSRPAFLRIAEISAGNPFYALELAHAIDEDSPTGMALPDTLAAVVGEHLGRPGSLVQEVLLAAAAAAAPTVEQIAAACGITSDQALARLEQAQIHRIVALDGSRVHFTHPLLATGAYTGATGAQRRAVNRALSATVDHPELKARHLALSATTGDAATLASLDDAADAAVARGAPSAAAELIDLAIGLGGDSQERQLRHAELLYRCGSPERARVLLEALIDEMAPGPLRAKALSLLGAVLVYGNSFPQAVEVLTRALHDSRDDPVLHLVTLLRLAPTTGVAGDREASVAFARQAKVCAETVGVDALRSEALTMWVNISCLYGLGFDEQALRIALKLEDPRSESHLTYRASAVEAVTTSWRGRPDQPREFFRVLAQRAEERGDEPAAIWIAEHSVMADVWLGRYRDAAHTAADASTRAEQIGGQHVTVIATALRAAAAAYGGRADAARRWATAAIAGARASGGEHLAIGPRVSLAFLEASVGDYPAAFDAFAPLLAAFDPQYGTEIVMGGFLPDAVETLLALGRPRDAEPLVDALETNGARLDRPWMLAVGARGRAMLLAAEGDLAGAERAARGAMIEHDRLPMPFERARTQLLLGQVLRRSRQNSSAADTLTEALDTFTRIGAPRWARRAVVQLNQNGSAPDTGTALTPAEVRVARRAADGLSNKQIAAELFIAEKTVEANLSRVYRKLGVRSRSGLFDALGPDIR